MPPTQVECPVCLSLWIWEANQWRQLSWAERQRIEAGVEIGA